MHDYIIVGNGIAGSVLSYHLCEEGKSLCIIDEDSPKASWRVAGGVWNGITFKKLVKGWMADETTDEAHLFYQALMERFDVPFYEPKEIVRFFGDVHSQNTWMAKSGDPNFVDYLKDELPDEVKKLPLKTPYGAGCVKKGGYVKLPLFMKAIKAHLNNLAVIKKEKFDFDQLEVNAEGIKYKEIKAKSIIFCEGFEVTKNPYFKWLPMNLTKGETLTLKNPGWNFDSILNNGKHLLDHKDGTLGVGATFEWKTLDHEVTKEGREKLLNHLEKNFEFKDWEVLDQKAGIRPTVADRRPLAGVHPSIKNIYIFNGLGTKGVLIAPWMAKRMLAFLEKGIELPEESNIKRFQKKYFV